MHLQSADQCKVLVTPLERRGDALTEAGLVQFFTTMAASDGGAKTLTNLITYARAGPMQAQSQHMFIFSFIKLIRTCVM